MKSLEGADPGQLLNVSLDECIHVVARPGPAASRHRAAERRGIATRSHQFRKILPEAFTAPKRERASENRVERAAPATLDLRAAEGMQTEDFHAAGEGVGELRYPQDVSGPGQQERSGPPAAIDRGLQGQEDLGHALDLVEGRVRGETVEESGRVGPGRFQRDALVEADVGPTARVSDLPCEGGLAALSGAVD